MCERPSSLESVTAPVAFTASRPGVMDIAKCRDSAEAPGVNVTLPWTLASLAGGKQSGMPRHAANSNATAMTDKWGPAPRMTSP